jgi:tetratricopeptide (TPR) repeat protein
MTDYRQTVEATVGKIDALEQITQSVGDYFERLPPSLRDDRAESLRTRLLVLRGEIFTSQGRLNEAASVLDGAIAEAGKRARISAPTPPNAPPWPLVEAAALVSRTNVALRQDSPEAGSLAKRAIASARPVLPNTPAGGEAERLLGLALFFHGKCESKAGRPDAAQAALEESLALAQKVADSDGTNLQKQREHLWAMIELAKICKVRGAGVLKDLATGRKPSPTATTAPTGPDPKTEDASAARTRADSLLGKAQELYLSAKSTLEALSKLQPWNFPLRRDLGVVLDGLGDIALTWKKDPASAISYYQQYLANSIDLSAHDPENLEWKKETIVAHRALAGTFHAMRQQEEAFKHFDQAISMREHLIAQDPSDAKLLRDHCDTLLDRGDARFGAKMFDGAKADYTAAENIAMNAEKSDKEPAWWENRRVGIHFRWGALHLRQEPDGASAKERLALAVALAERLKTQGILAAPAEEAGRTAASLLRRLQTPASNESSPAPKTPPGPPPSPQPGGEK